MGLGLRLGVTGEGRSKRVVISADGPVDDGYGILSIPTVRESIVPGGGRSYAMSLSPVIALALKDSLRMVKRDGGSIVFDGDARIALSAMERMNSPATVSWDDASGRAIVRCPRTPMYSGVLRRSGASPRTDGSWSIPLSRLHDLRSMDASLPRSERFSWSEDVLDVMTEHLPAPYDGTAESLLRIPVDALRTVRANSQSRAMLVASRRSISEKLTDMGVRSLYDLLMLRPRRYIDRSHPQDVRDLVEGETATVIGRLAEWRTPSPRLLIMVIEDRTGVQVECSFFNSEWLRSKWNVGDELIVTGPYKPWHARNGYIRPQISQPQIDPVDAAGALPVMPVYSTPARAAISSMTIMRCEQELISRLGPGFRGPAWADPALRANGITDITYGDALKSMHLPRSTEDVTRGSSALSFCEMVELMIVIEASHRGEESRPGVISIGDGSMTGAYTSALPFVLTESQSRSVESLREAMRTGDRVHALLVGDVGSGKTTVMHLAALLAVEAGHQAVICAPTEILARQLHDVFLTNWSRVDPAVRDRVHVALHAGYSGKGAAARRRATVTGVANGSVNLVFGTHSVLNLDYHDLGFVGVDEQHKFGAAQRSRLLDVRSDGRVPAMLMQTATPIPRSMAQVYYGDVQYLSLDEMPSGRIPIETRWVKRKGGDVVNDSSCPIWADVLAEAHRGHGTFVVCPMVTESEKTDAASVRRTAKELERMLPGLTIRSVYGGQDRAKQGEIIAGIRNGDVDVLVASSVVEVGVSCEKATRMVILDANRFGMASLHQIRGRIGRSNLPSTCWLVAMPFTESGTKRMEAMTSTLDGWTLAKADLRNRGAGSLFGTEQHGRSDLLFVDLVRDARMIGPARTVARSVIDAEGEQAVDIALRYFGSDGEILS